jgi:hypothetical protein
MDNDTASKIINDLMSAFQDNIAQTAFPASSAI